MYRIITAIDNINEDKIFLNDLLHMCKKLNEYRKMDDKPDDIKSIIQNFYNKVGLKKVSTKVEFLVIITYFIISKLPKDKIIFKKTLL